SRAERGHLLVRASKHGHAAQLMCEVDVVKKISEMEQKAQVWQGDLDQELHRLNRQLNEQTSQVETLKRHLDQKKRNGSDGSSEERGFEDARAAQLREREELLQAKEKQLREREELLQAKEKQLLEREQTLQREKKLLHEREQSFIAKERQLLEREQTLQTEKKLQMEREQYLQSKDQQLFEREEALQSATKLQQQQELEHFQTERQLERARAKSQDYNLTAPAPAAPAPPAAPRGRKTEPRGPRGPRGAVKDRSSRSREREMKQKDPEHRKTKRRRTELYRTFEEQRWTWYKTLATPIATPSPAAAVTAAVTARSAAASRHVEPVKPKVDREEADPPLHRLGSARPILLETVEEELMLELDEVDEEELFGALCSQEPRAEPRTKDHEATPAAAAVPELVAKGAENAQHAAQRVEPALSSVHVELDDGLDEADELHPPPPVPDEKSKTPPVPAPAPTPVERATEGGAEGGSTGGSGAGGAWNKKKDWYQRHYPQQPALRANARSRPVPSTLRKNGHKPGGAALFPREAWASVPLKHPEPVKDPIPELSDLLALLAPPPPVDDVLPRLKTS
ncbi:unnamed protein product, partial [Durusdinium trenchii]